jgi:3-polyprenyl-4-hydroxybenzoate decarboxylase
MGEEKEFGFVRGNLIDNLSVLEYHKRTLDMIKQIDEQISKVEPEIAAIGPKPQFKNPRNEATYLHNFKTLTVLMRQRERLKQKLVEIQERLQEDMNASKSVTPLKPLKKLQ